MAIAACMALLAPLPVPSRTLAQDTAYQLQLSDRIGEASRYRLTFEIEMKADYSGEGAAEARARELMEALGSGMELRTTVVYEQRLTDVAGDGTRTFQVRWHDYDFSGAIGDVPIPKPPEHVESTRALLSHSAQLRTTASGRTIEVIYTHPDLEALDRRFRQMGGSMPTYLPEDPVVVGDSWTSVVEFPTGISTSAGASTMNLELRHTLKEIRQSPSGPLAVIELAGSYSQMQGIEISGDSPPMHVQVSLTGSTLFDIGFGRFSGGRYELDMLAVHAANGIELQLTGYANGTLELVSEP